MSETGYPTLDRHSTPPSPEEESKNFNEMHSHEFKFGHLMIDLETMGDESHSAIVSIGAIEFDINTGLKGRLFYRNIDLQSCLDYGLIVTGSTIMWWMEQNEQARKDLTKRIGMHIAGVLVEFRDFIGDRDYQVWGNSARFDCGILKNAYDKCNIKAPWDFRKERCFRTLMSLAPDVKERMKFIGTVHNPICDCNYQIACCTEVWKALQLKAQ